MKNAKALKFSGNFYQHLGVTQWHSRPGFESVSRQDVAEEISAINGNVDVQQDVANLAVVEAEAVVVVDKVELPASAVQSIDNPVVIIGHGIQSFWQDEESLEWQLWCNIMQAFDWQEEQVLFVDSALLMSEEQTFASMEEVIAMGAERVLSMDDEHEINEVLTEGAEVLSVPDFDMMLSDPYAKKSFYQQALKLYG